MTPQQSINLKAKTAALAAMQRLPIEPTSLVNYRSKGRVVIIGDNQALEIAPRLNERLHAMVILTQGVEEPGVPLIPLGGRAIHIEGYLGDFRILLAGGGEHNTETIAADLILDLSPTPLINAQMKPPGYVYSEMEEVALQAAVEELEELTGSFEKPRYFDYNPDICAHGHAGKTACNRCIEACPADAIKSLAETIEVNAHLCQGGGVCATVCPSGAIRYAYPNPKDNLDRMRRLLSVYREEGGFDPVVVFIAESDDFVTDSLPTNYLPFLVEELASVGLEFWLSTLAFGAHSVLLLNGGGVPERSVKALEEQLRTVDEIITAMGYAAGLVSLIAPEDLDTEQIVSMPAIKPAGFSGLGGKRQTAYLAIDHLFTEAEKPKPMVSLTVGAPFGKADVDANACTLCFSCVGACPGKALQTGGEGVPQLLFIEDNCLQCGMCTRTCPEDAIWITPRLLFDADQRRQKRKLHEEAPFLCTSCGKPFATRSVIDNMLNKLQGHYMFQNERARKRLTMCEDCRVIDIVQDQEAMNGGIDGRFRQ
ncbi:MAG: 4Fe-4S binding protein [Candidatus Thiodiazotropha sp. (ex Monitilora ramsayi)]|nr:4Fe-4S binding protein [Candidatus Thiodiazotropha sp. (ex Monitilora ramsayi)]